ncbi:hypothetical protein BDR07DRAFT_711939 [Suillus spraguei]|nr:hypothetical protein BDR07DRAFT_711939 [Suillus spraguei]
MYPQEPKGSPDRQKRFTKKDGTRTTLVSIFAWSAWRRKTPSLGTDAKKFKFCIPMKSANDTSQVRGKTAVGPSSPTLLAVAAEGMRPRGSRKNANLDWRAVLCRCPIRD